jgi:hypothetical protein
MKKILGDEDLGAYVTHFLISINKLHVFLNISNPKCIYLLVMTLKKEVEEENIKIIR